MSDNEGGKKGGYRVEEAASGRAKCKGPQPCKGTAIGKGELRLGSLVDFRGNTSWAWRHWGCTTKKIIDNMKKTFDDAKDLDGFDEISEENQNKLIAAWESGEVADEDIPASARKPAKYDDEEVEDKPKKRTRKKKDDDDDEAKPKKRTKKKKDDDDEEPAPKKKKAAPKKTADKKAPVKKRGKKKTADTESEGENFGEEMDAVVSEESEAELTDDEPRKKKKKASPKKKASKKQVSDDDD